MKLIRAGAATLLFLLILLTTYFLHIRFLSVDVVFYAAIADGVIAAIITAIIVFACSWFKAINAFEKMLLMVIWLLTGYAFAISVPTVIDRSLSFYILEKLQQRGGGIQQQFMSEVFTKEYLNEHRLVDVRLTEQLASGTIAIDNGCVYLTSKGQEIASFGRYFRANWLPKQRLLMGHYSDALTDPFRTSVERADYVCSPQR